MAKEVKEKKTPTRVQRIVDACRGGQRLCKSIATTRDGHAEPRWFLHPSNRNIGPRTAEQAAEILTPASDGLFGPEWSQTWGA